jgi:hypothetical protein
MGAGHREGGNRPARGRGVVPALCAAVLCVGLAVGVLVEINSVGGNSASVPTQDLAAQLPTAQIPTVQASIAQVPTIQSGEPPVEDVVTLPVGQQYVWPSGIGLVVRPPTVTAPTTTGGVAVVRVQTLVLNGSTTPYDVDAVLGPSARFGGHDVAPYADSRFAAGTVEQVVPPGQRLAYETTFPAGTGALTLHYRADFRYEAVEFEASAITSHHS